MSEAQLALGIGRTHGTSVCLMRCSCEPLPAFTHVDGAVRPQAAGPDVPA